MRVGMEQSARIPHYADVALPEDEIAATQMIEVFVDRQRMAKRGLLQIGIARRGMAGGGEGDLDQT